VARIDVTEGDDGRVVTGTVGDELVVVLHENATTGYRWALDEATEQVRLLADGYVPVTEPPSAEPQIGRGGLRELRFVIVSPGAGTLRLLHRREWEGAGSAIGSLTLRVEASRPDRLA
jgi:inhibitor of cysteine peptidase